MAPEFWDVDAKLRHMDRLGIDASVLSLTPTLFFYWLDAAPAEDFCRLANDSLARLASQSDGRLFGMAVVPMQRPEAAVAELRRAVNELGLRGVMIGTTIGDAPLDDARFTPFFARGRGTGRAGDAASVLRRRSRPTRSSDFYMVNLTGNPMETCFAATRLILSGFFDRHPLLDVVLVHAGGFMPYQIGRLDHGFRVRPETKRPPEDAALGLSAALLVRHDHARHHPAEVPDRARRAPIASCSAPTSRSTWQTSGLRPTCRKRVSAPGV